MAELRNRQEEESASTTMRCKELLQLEKNLAPALVKVKDSSAHAVAIRKE